MAHIFVSYDKEDRALAERVVRALRADGFSVWWDDDLTPHLNWDRAIEAELEAATWVLVLWTPRSVQSNWVRSEADFAKEDTPPKLIQARFENARVPLAFRLTMYVDLDEAAPDKCSGWQRLGQWLRGKQARESDERPSPPIEEPVADPDVPRQFAVLLRSDSGNKIPVIKAVKQLLDLGLTEAKNFVENAPQSIICRDQEDADYVYAELASSGADVSVYTLKDDLDLPEYFRSIGLRDIESPATERLDIVVRNDGGRKIDTIKAIRELTGMSLTDSKNFVETLPRELTSMGVRESRRAFKLLQDAGAHVEWSRSVPHSASAGNFDVFLKSCGDNKISVIKTVRQYTSLGLTESKALVETAPRVVATRLDESAANAMVDELRRSGASATLMHSDPS